MSQGRRIRGRAGQALRHRRLAMHPTCAECAKRGLVRATDVIDHVVPLAFGGEDVDENTQGLCHLCHAIKTATESPSAEAAANHPLWLKPALGKLSIVCGPPCSGKTTFVQARAADRDAVIDLDAILARLDPAFRPWRGRTDPALLNRAVRIRNAMLGSLSSPPPRVGWFIVAAPTQAERLWWQQQLGGAIVLLEPGLKVCEERAAKRGTPGAVLGIRRWYAEARQWWQGPAKRKPPRLAFGPDGYPLEEDACE